MQQSHYRPTTQFSVFPPVIKHLLILNGLLYFAKFAVAQTGAVSFAEILNAMALYAPGSGDRGYWIFGGGIVDIPGFQIWQVVTYGFLHGPPSHLFFNMFALWMFGIQLENDWGSKRFGVYYLACIVGAAVVQMIVATGYAGPAYPTIGASGGVFGILLGFGMMYPNQPIYLILFPVPIKAKWFVIGYGLIELFSGVTGVMPGVAHFAHLGGMLFGFLLILYWRGKLPMKPKSPWGW